jgi:hypothetical protein
MATAGAQLATGSRPRGTTGNRQQAKKRKTVAADTATQVFDEAKARQALSTATGLAELHEGEGRNMRERAAELERLIALWKEQKAKAPGEELIAKTVADIVGAIVAKAEAEAAAEVAEAAAAAEVVRGELLVAQLMASIIAKVVA